MSDDKLINAAIDAACRQYEEDHRPDQIVAPWITVPSGGDRACYWVR